MKRWITFALVTFVLLMAFRSARSDNVTPSFVSTSPGPRLTVFISDLHLGVGRQANGTWHACEDFRWAKEFSQFLRAIDGLGHGATDLVFNGDTFELWQSLADDCSQQDLGCTENEALARIQRVLAEHAAELQSIGMFANAGENRVVIVPGNHDVALFFSAVANAVLTAIPAKPGRIRIATEGYWLSADQLVYAEHGHQIGEEVNRFDAWPPPFVQLDGRIYLQRPWGERFVQKYYNQWELKYPIIDNITDEGTGVRYGLAAEGSANAAPRIGQFFKFFLLQVSSIQFKQALGEVDRPARWDIKRISRDGNQFLLDSIRILQDDELTTAAAAAVAEKTVDFSTLGLTEDQIVSICDQRALARKMQIETRGSSAVTECPRLEGHLGAIAENLFRSRNKLFSEHIEKTYKALLETGQASKRFTVFIFSHTHRAVPGFYPLRSAHRPWDPVVVNTGAWQRVITPERLEEIKRQQNLTTAQVLTRLTPEDLPACYSVILVEPKEGGLIPQLRFWREASPGQWTLDKTCR